MAILDILEFPDPRLRTKAKPVTKVDEKIRKLTDDMLQTMYQAPGIGLAATQVNVHQRIVVIDVSEEKDSPLILINPEFEILEGEQDYDEGCLSVPGHYETVTRAEKILLKALDRDGNPYEMECDGLLSTCIQHELDHLDGKLFVDHISKLKRERIRKKLVKEQKERVRVR
ncbi:peptide deformylase [Ketobacter sp. MCCC 1A13808]|uniref:peptide deformylase n=1 Tax=Ketobacter sp. MCCC 1A13808 TaxID=2602738 RepID=UPI000F27D344|nr:peptide deformylase [Ketobacter sp. MCCC 1A13808]MVF14281.1 peptide deformylase [Ketobacter sp. MCCC 1A13808]RLP53532.1 MAG: peptide deformylase [Ketobacter sp.]